MLKNECELMTTARDKENKAIRLWKRMALAVVAFFAIMMCGLYIMDSPYRKLHVMIEEQSLTAAMCSWKYREREGSYYVFFLTEKGHKLLASELSELHKKDDINKAMWLLCVQPDCIDGQSLCASPDFIKWIVEYAKINGRRNTVGYSSYNVSYFIDGYTVTISSYDDNRPHAYDIRSFSITDGKNQTKICARESYNIKENIPTIE